MKIRKRNCKSLKEFNKIIRKYIKYFGLRWDNYQRYWYVWLTYDVLHDELYSKEIENYAKTQVNLPQILKEARENYGFEFTHKNGKIYKFVGIQITNEDFYYVFMSEDGARIDSTCVGYWTDVVKYYGNEINN